MKCMSKLTEASFLLIRAMALVKDHEAIFNHINSALDHLLDGIKFEKEQSES